jgi:PAS domain S-box-containing protein
LVGIEPILGELLTEKTKGYELSGIARLTAEDYPLYFDLYIHTYRPSVPGDLPRLIILINNATDRMLFQQQLLQTANESQLLLKRLATTKNYISQVMYSMADALIVTTQSGIIKQTNPAAQRLFGYKDYELLAQPISNLVRDPQFLNNIARGQPVDQAEVTCQRRNQKTLYVSFSCGVIITEDDQQEFVYVGRDVTERKLAEAQIRQLNQSLRDRTQELELANEELESFSRTVSHDLRAPLGHINAFYQLLREDYSTQWPAEAQDYLEQIYLASQRMERLIHDLLQLSRATRLELTRDKVDLGALAHQVMQQLRRSEPDRACTVTIAPQVWVWGNYALLQIVMENLLRNAWKYTSKRGMAEIEFGVSRAVTLNYPLATSGRVFWVRDNGAGFNMAYADKLFQTFSRLHSPREFEGTGIGLATVHRIIHRHGGQIWAEAVEDQGATFYFTLDANSPELHAADSSV